MTARHILLVEDEADIREIAELCLKLATWDVTTAANGQQALDIAAKLDFDAVLLDFRMPGMDGLTVLRRLRQSPKTASTPVILFTASLHKTELAPMHGLGIAGVIAKPFDPLQLSAEVSRLAGWL